MPACAATCCARCATDVVLRRWPAAMRGGCCWRPACRMGTAPSPAAAAPARRRCPSQPLQHLSQARRLFPPGYRHAIPQASQHVCFMVVQISLNVGCQLTGLGPGQVAALFRALIAAVLLNVTGSGAAGLATSADPATRRGGGVTAAPASPTKAPPAATVQAESGAAPLAALPTPSPLGPLPPASTASGASNCSLASRPC